VFEPNQRVKVNLSGLTIKGVGFSQNVQEALGTIIQRIAAEPSTYLVELFFSFKGIRRVEVPENASGARSIAFREESEATNDVLGLLDGRFVRRRGAQCVNEGVFGVWRKGLRRDRAG
jgi:hypothetical protein